MVTQKNIQIVICRTLIWYIFYYLADEKESYQVQCRRADVFEMTGNQQVKHSSDKDKSTLDLLIIVTCCICMIFNLSVFRLIVH